MVGRKWEVCRMIVFPHFRQERLFPLNSYLVFKSHSKVSKSHLTFDIPEGYSNPVKDLR